MAATPSKPSPSQKSVEGEAAAPTTVKDASAGAAVEEQTVVSEGAPPAVAPAIAPTDTLKAPPASSIPTYDSSEASKHYTTAKLLLNEGDFEGALEVIEEGIEITKAMLAGAADNDEALHEAMAPFHYLYGTTLLYSIEESVDPNQQMTNATGGEEEVPAAGVASAAAASADGQEQQQPEEGADAQNVEDMEIAWENLETARTIMDRLVKEHPDSDKLKADLAQIHLRCGDLQRQNSAYEAAIADYTACLKYRQNNSTIAAFSRKIADVHYNLGLVYFNRVAETKVPEEGENPEEAAKVKQSIDDARNQAYFHLFECGKIFGGIVADLCGNDPMDVLEKSNQVPNFKTTGEEEMSSEHPKILGLKLQNLRKIVSEMTVPEVAQLDYNDCVAVLEEIQETIDEAENSEKGVHEAKDMKEEIAALVAAQNSEGTTTTTEDGATTQIGFGSAAAVASTAVAQPIMMVKKKKRPNTDVEGEDVKLPAKEPPKRHKSSE